jgi:hypothetical protein
MFNGYFEIINWSNSWSAGALDPFIPMEKLVGIKAQGAYADGVVNEMGLRPSENQFGGKYVFQSTGCCRDAGYGNTLQVCVVTQR